MTFESDLFLILPTLDPFYLCLVNLIGLQISMFWIGTLNKRFRQRVASAVPRAVHPTPRFHPEPRPIFLQAPLVNACLVMHQKR